MYQGTNIGPINQAATALALMYVYDQSNYRIKPPDPQQIKLNLLENVKRYGVYPIILKPLLSIIHVSINNGRFENAALINPIINLINPTIAKEFSEKFNLPLDLNLIQTDLTKFQKKYGWHDIPFKKILKKKGAYDDEDNFLDTMEDSSRKGNSCFNLGPECGDQVKEQAATAFTAGLFGGVPLEAAAAAAAVTIAVSKACSEYRTNCIGFDYMNYKKPTNNKFTYPVYNPPQPPSGLRKSGIIKDPFK